MTIMIQSCDYYGKLHLHYSEEGKKSFVAHQKKLGMRAKATDTCGGRLSCEQTLNKCHSPPSPKYTILAIKTDLHSMHASTLSIQDHSFQWETGRAVF